MRMTYRQLRTMMEHFNDDQLDSDITVEFQDEYWPATLRITGPEHDGGLDDNHPVIYAYYDEVGHRYDNQTLNDYILNLQNKRAFA